ncbi:MAG: hypothetical protein JSW08_02935 [archaeon]|nr:MAG: hypothetical protein JSW08_02935 [archaeon]
MQEVCIQCRGRGFCGHACKILAKLKQYQPKVKLEFSGSSPPEVFVGHYNYPNVYTGVLSPAEFGNTEEFSYPELWHEQNKDLLEILNLRSRMIYSRFTSNIKKSNMLKERMQELALASKATDVDFMLARKPSMKLELHRHVAMIGSPAPVKSIKVESNIKVEKKIDYLANDTDAKAADSILELHDSGIQVSNVIKLLTAGLLGLKIQRKLVPTRWAVTATDSIISKALLRNIRNYSQLQEYRLFHANYLGNYYEILMIPGCWSYEVMEVADKGYYGSQNVATWQDYEFFKERKTYPSSVIGAYYATRLAVTEYLERIRKQATVLVFREIRPEYWAPCGVGILRETVREALSKRPEVFDNLEAAMISMQGRLKLGIEHFVSSSKLIKERKTQRSLFDF